jgi:hypothetical protein
VAQNEAWALHDRVAHERLDRAVATSAATAAAGGGHGGHLAAWPSCCSLEASPLHAPAAPMPLQQQRDRQQQQQQQQQRQQQDTPFMRELVRRRTSEGSSQSVPSRNKHDGSSDGGAADAPAACQDSGACRRDALPSKASSRRVSAELGHSIRSGDCQLAVDAYPDMVSPRQGHEAWDAGRWKV